MILCCGDALIDMIADAQTGSFKPVVGGGIFNLACGVAGLSGQTALASGLSLDPFGEMLRHELSKKNVDISACFDTPDLTPLAFVDLRDGQAEYRFYQSQTALDISINQSLPSLDSRVQLSHFGGISLCAENSGVYYHKFLEALPTDCLISCDPNVRCDFINDAPAYRKRIDYFLKKTDILKMSDEDFNWLYPDLDIDTYAREKLAEKAGLILYTQGAGDIHIYHRLFTLKQPVPKVKIVDTIGAGDSLWAGFLYQLQYQNLLSREQLAQLSERQCQEILSFALKVCQFTLSRTGAVMPSLTDLA